MTRRSIILATLALLGLTSVPAFAQTANKTWVSSTSGNDSGTCQFVSPCKTFAYAITQTAAGGELDVKDAGSYGVATITKAISIVADGVLGAIAVPSAADGITVSAGASDRVVLQGLIIDGHGVAHSGINFGSGNLTVTDCHIRNAVYGILVENANTRVLHISKTEIGNASSVGVNVVPGPGYTVQATLNQVDLHSNYTGLSVFSNGSPSGYTTATITNSTVTDNNIGLTADSTNNLGLILVSQTVTANNATYGIKVGSGGEIASTGDNVINDELSGSLTNFSKR